jgi:DNA-binding NarL/FixJ family response regulator
MGQVVRLVLADGHPAFAEGLAMILEAEADLAVGGIAHDCRRVVELAAAQRPSVLLLDTQLPGGDPTRTLAAVKAASPTTRVLLLSLSARGNMPEAAVGADGVLAEDGSSRQLADAIRRAVQGRRTVVVMESPRPSRREPDLEVLWARILSAREREVLGLLAKGWSTRRIADEWHVSVLTVRTHVQNVLTKLGVHSQLEAVAFAFQHGMVAFNEGAPLRVP